MRSGLQNILQGAGTVSADTQCLPFTDMLAQGHNFLLYLINMSSQAVYVKFQTSQDGAHPDVATEAETLIAAGGQASMWRGPWEIRRYWQISARSFDGQPAAVKWGVTVAQDG